MAAAEPRAPPPPGVPEPRGRRTPSNAPASPSPPDTHTPASSPARAGRQSLALQGRPQPPASSRALSCQLGG